MWYRIDFNRLVIDCLPLVLRKPKLIAWLQGVVKPIITIYDEFILMRQRNLYKVVTTGQVCYFRKALNDHFDVSERRIYIGDANKYDRFYIYTRGEEKPYLLGSKLIYSPDDYVDTGVDFIVYVPIEIVLSKKFEIEAFVNFFKKGSKKFKIEKYE